MTAVVAAVVAAVVPVDSTALKTVFIAVLVIVPTDVKEIVSPDVKKIVIIPVPKHVHISALDNAFCLVLVAKMVALGNAIAAIHRAIQVA